MKSVSTKFLDGDQMPDLDITYCLHSETTLSSSPNLNELPLDLGQHVEGIDNSHMLRERGRHCRVRPEAVIAGRRLSGMLAESRMDIAGEAAALDSCGHALGSNGNFRGRDNQ